MNTDIFWILQKEEEVCDANRKDCWHCPLGDALDCFCMKLTSETIRINQYSVDRLVKKLNEIERKENKNVQNGN